MYTMFNYKEACRDIISSLPERTKDIVSRRFGLFGGEKETLEFIGKNYGVTRERVRQIEKDGVRQARNKSEQYSDIFNYFENKLEEFGGLKREDVFLNILSYEKNDKNCINFLLNISNSLYRFSENTEFHAFWLKDQKVFFRANEVINEVKKELKKKRKLLSVKELSAKKDIPEKTIVSYLEISKRIVQNEEGNFGLFEWPEINPRGIKDKAYLVLKKFGKPLHFKEIASHLGDDANPQTTHNELIKDPSFVLVGRGVYALADWGYSPGEVKEVIRDILKKEGALPKNEIIDRVSKQRIVKKNTVIQNLSNKKYFVRTPDGKYTIA